MLERMKTGKCPFTGKPYDCSRCEVYKDLKNPENAPYNLHMSLYFGEAITDGTKGLRWLKKVVGRQYSFDDLREYFGGMYQLGATHHPIGECDNFCFRKGCMGHAKQATGVTVNSIGGDQ